MTAPRLNRLLAVVATAFVSQASFAQNDPAPASRAEIKAETRAAEKAGKLTPAGEGVKPTQPGGAQSTKTRAERKAETREARKTGELEPAGEAGDFKSDQAARSATSTKTREQRKAETLAAAKAHQLTPAGEGPDSPKK